jgi:CubicO group peptidase (beta-lactamase class C family)
MAVRLRSTAVSALDVVRSWDVPAVAAGVTDARAALATVGDLHRQFWLASVTKLLTATAALVALEEGTVGLDEPAGPPGSTVRHLLAHASGLPFEGDQPIAAPGVRRIYSNTGFERFADHLAAAADMGFGVYLQGALLDPLTLSDSRLDGSPAKDAWGSVGDLLAFGRQLLAPTLVSVETMAAAATVVFPGLKGMLPGIGPEDPMDWGLGFELRGHKSPHWTGSSNSPATFGHFGGAGTFLWVDPVAGLACACLTDREFGPWALDAWPALSDAVLAEFT